MSRIDIRKTFALLSLAAAVPALAQQPFISDSAIRAIAVERIGARANAGIVVALLEKGRDPRVVSTGVSGADEVPLDANTVFEIGSITKVFTGALLADMVARGEVRLDDPVAKYLPRGTRVPSRNGKQITLLDLATQSSGLPRLPNNLSPPDITNPYADYTIEKLYAFLSSYELPRDPGEKYEYSNIGFGLLGHALALRAGKPYEQLLRERILDPLAMNDTRVALTPSMQARMARGTDAFGRPTRTWDFPALAGAGALKSTASDLLKFLRANLEGKPANVARVLADARNARHDTDRPGSTIGLAWHILDLLGTTATWHNGGTGGFRTFVGMDMVRGRGVIVLTNWTGNPDDIGFHLLEPKVHLLPQQ
jgi:CubicO group peptidase (beta-lactamase class C family)